MRRAFPGTMATTTNKGILHSNIAVWIPRKTNFLRNTDSAFGNLRFSKHFRQFQSQLSIHGAGHNRRLLRRRVNAKAMGQEPPKSVPVQVAFELLQSGFRYLDVRTLEEFTAGHVEGAINIPYMLKAEAGMVKNPDFLAEVSSQFKKDEEILVGCQYGRRSPMAAKDLLAGNFAKIIDVEGGFTAWVQNGLPVHK